MAIEIWSENGSSSVLRGVRSILVTMVLFKVSGHGHPKDDATTSFFMNSKSSMLGLSNGISFFVILFFERWPKWPFYYMVL